MEVPLLLQFSIALFTGMVAATFIPPVRRSIPKPVEVLLWVAFIAVCVLGVVSITDPNARELSTSALWGADQMINNLAGMMFGGVFAWVFEHRFNIASWLAIVGGADLFALVLIRSRKAAQPWQPRIRLREWMEMPVPAPVVIEPAQVSDPIGDLNRRIAAGMAIAGTTMLANVLDFAIWARDVMLPRETRRLARAAQAGRVRSRTSLEALRDSTAHLQYAAMAWYAAAGRPAVHGAVTGIAGKATLAVHQAKQAQRVLKPVTERAGQVIDIQTLMSAQSIGWYGPLLAAPTPGEGENNESEQAQRPDRLAS